MSPMRFEVGLSIDHRRHAVTGQRDEVGVGHVLVAVGIGQALGLTPNVRPSRWARPAAGAGKCIGRSKFSRMPSDCAMAMPPDDGGDMADGSCGKWCTPARAFGLVVPEVGDRHQAGVMGVWPHRRPPIGRPWPRWHLPEGRNTWRRPRRWPGCAATGRKAGWWSRCPWSWGCRRR